MKKSTVAAAMVFALAAIGVSPAVSPASAQSSAQGVNVPNSAVVGARGPIFSRGAKASSSYQTLSASEIASIQDRRAYQRVLRTEDAEAIAYFLVDNAKDGKVWAMRQLGAFYNGSQGLADHPAKALYWYHEAAVSGDAESALIVGGAFARGVVVEKDEQLAAFWLDRAKNNGDWRVKKDADVLLASL